MKFGAGLGGSGVRPSFPSWERGLKYRGSHDHPPIRRVVPLVGAWIEISFSKASIWALQVVPLVGAWIEIAPPPGAERLGYVVPLVGAWIEIAPNIDTIILVLSFPSWERGLK